jgi:hypothetical protein
MATKRAKVNKTLEKAKKLVSKKGKNKTKKGTWPEGQAKPQSKAYDIENDKTVPAKRTGYRFTKEGAKKLGKQPNDRPTAEEIDKYRNQTFKVKGKVNKSGPKGVGDGSFRYLYIESRADKSDLNKARKLEDGGEMAKGGEMTDGAEFFYISGYWKNDKSEFKDYLVTSADDFVDDDGDDYDIFYYGMTEKDIKDAIKDGEKTDLEFVITSYSKANYSKGGVVFDPKEVRQFEKYVFSWYGKNGVAVDDMEEDIPATTAEVLKAVSQYLAFCTKTKKWGGGDSFDREVVHDIIAYNRNPKTTALFYEDLIEDMKKTPILEYGGILQPMIGGVDADPRFDIYNTTMFAKKGAEVPHGEKEQVKFFEIVNEIKNLEYDGDPKDRRLHSESRFYWGANNEDDYDEATKQINQIGIKGKGWEIYATYDVSGYDYWMKTTREPNYIHIVVSFDKQTVHEDEIGKIESALYEAIMDAERISNAFDYDPSTSDDDDYAKGGIVKDIEAKKKALIKKAKARGIYENFGQKEVQELQDKYGHYSKEIAEFDNWAMNFDNDDLKNYEDGGEMAKGGKIYDREDFHEWIHKNHPTFDIDDEEFEMFIDEHYQNMLPHAKNFQNLKEWLDGEYAKGGSTKKGWSIAEDYSGVGGTKNPSYYLYNQDTGETKGRSARLTKKEATEKMKKLGYMAHGGSTHQQGYDDREDERLAMRHGKIASKDFVGSHKRREHSRRDDARFETRNK